jgi:hypothetical protein
VSKPPAPEVGLTAWMLLLIVLVLAGCGGGGLSEEERMTQAESLMAGVRAKQVARRDAAGRKARRRCSTQLARVRAGVSKVEDLFSAKWIPYDEYADRVAPLARELDRLDLTELSVRCTAVAAQLERASITHEKAVDEWRLCNEINELAAAAGDPPPSICGKQLTDDPHRWWRLTARACAKAEALLERTRTPRGGVGGFSLEVPETSGQVEDSVYAAAAKYLRGPLASAEACATLRHVLVDGVSEDELDDLDGATRDLLEAENLATG